MAKPKFKIASIFQAFDKISGPTKKMKKSVSGFSKSAQRSLRGVNKSFKTLSRTLTVIKAAIIGGAVYKLGQSFVSAASQVEGYKKTLEVMLGSQEEASKRFEELSKFSNVTPFDLPQVVEFGNQLQAIGRYSKENMSMLGDLAAAAGKPLEQVTGAFAKLATGQKGMAVDMFRDLLISTDDWIAATGKGITKSGQLLATTEEMIAALPKILKAKGFFGMMEEQSKTFAAAMSNMRGKIFEFRVGVGEAFLDPIGEIIKSVSGVVGKITAWIKANKELIKQRVRKVFEALSRGAAAVWRILRKLYEVIKPVIRSIAEWIKKNEGLKKLLGGIADALQRMWNFVSKLTRAFAGGFLDAVKGIEEPLGGIFESLGKIFDLMSGGEGTVGDLTKMFRGLGMIIGGSLVAGMQMFNALLSEAVYLMAAADIIAQTRQAWRTGDLATIAQKKEEMAELRRQQQRSRQQQDIAFRQYREDWGRKYDKNLRPEAGGASGGWGGPSAGAGASGGWGGESRLTVDVEITKVPPGVAAQAGVRSKSPGIDLPRGRAGSSGQW